MTRLLIDTEDNRAVYGSYVPMEATNIFHNDRILVIGEHEGAEAIFEGGTVQPGTGFRCDINLAKELVASNLAKGANGFDPNDEDTVEKTPHFQVSVSELPGGSTAFTNSAFRPNTAPEGFTSNATTAPKTGEPAKTPDATKKNDNK